jgi:hydroxymethylpyrimidine pyrophosphatase-like HAD family hydrolase
MKTLYVTDLDGTLLLPDGTLGEHTASVINNLVAAGQLFSYATARSFLTASKATNGLRLAIPVITYGGTIIVDPRTGRPEITATIPAEAVESILRQCEAAGLQPILFVVHEGKDRVCWIDEGLTTGVAHFLSKRPGDPRLMPLQGWDEIELDSVFYISVIADLAPLQNLSEALTPEVRNDCDVLLSEDVYTAGEYWLEMTSHAGTKARAVKQVQRMMGAEKLVCFGDNFNDLALQRVADEFYAVANAVAEVKAQATSVIGSNADEGVAAWLLSSVRATKLSGR